LASDNTITIPNESNSSMTNEVAISQYGDGFDVEEPVGTGLVRGSLLRFKDPDFLVNGSDHLPEDVTQFTVVSMTTCWTRWWNEQPTHVVTQPGQQHPRRDELGDLDEKLWQKGKDGTKTDPWADTRHLVLVHDGSAATFTFVTSTTGGRIAISELKDAIKLRRRARPRSYPIVALETMTMKTRFGDRLRPHFRIVDWHEGEEPAPAAAPPTRPKPPQAMRIPASEIIGAVRGELTTAEVLDDDIPF
jgi:hypothetical protein